MTIYPFVKLFFLLHWLLIILPAGAQPEISPPSALQEVIYGRKDGMALTMVVFAPTGKSTGRGLIAVVSGAGQSSFEAVGQGGVQPYLDRGYTVFAVVHSSAPKYTLPEVVPDFRRAIRFIRYHAADYQVDPDHLGIMGGSGGGHLALLLDTSEEKPNPAAKDPVDRVSARVQVVACFFPPTDFLNYGRQGDNKLLDKDFLIRLGVAAPFAFVDFDSTSRYYKTVTDPERITAIGRQISPIYHVTPDDPPVLIAHGELDQVAPLQQSETFIQKLKEAKVPCQLIIKKGAGHGWPDREAEIEAFLAWFDQHLHVKRQKPAAAAPKVVKGQKKL